MQENGKRQDVFLALVEEEAALTPTEIGERIEESRQTVKYHLDKLVESGLVVREDNAYRCQQVFTDDELESEFVDLLANLVTAMSERIEVEDGAAAGRANAVFNCIRMFIALEVLEPADESDE